MTMTMLRNTLLLFAIFILAGPAPAPCQEKNGFFEKDFAIGIGEHDKDKPASSRTPAAEKHRTPSPPAPASSDKGFSDPFSKEPEGPKTDPYFSDLPSAADAEKDSSGKITSLGAVLLGTSAPSLKSNLDTLMGLLEYHHFMAGPVIIVGDPLDVGKILEEWIPKKQFENVVLGNPQELGNEEIVRRLYEVAPKLMNDPGVKLMAMLADRIQIVSAPPKDENGVEITYSPSWIMETPRGRILLEGVITPARNISAKGFFIAPDDSLLPSK